MHLRWGFRQNWPSNARLAPNLRDEIRGAGVVIKTCPTPTRKDSATQLDAAASPWAAIPPNAPAAIEIVHQRCTSRRKGNFFLQRQRFAV